MELKHTFTVPASVDRTWAAFNDLEGIAPCFPGATLTGVDGDDFTGTVKVKLGPISLQYSGTGTFVERDEANRRAVIEAKGKDKRGNGTAGATVVAQLAEDGDGTRVEVSTDLAVTGKPAQFGRGVMQDVSDKLLGRFVECIAGKLGPEAEPESEPEAEPAPASAEAASGAGAPTASPPGTKPPPPSGGGAPGNHRADTGGPSTSAGSTSSTSSTSSGAAAEELDLGATVLPVLARRYGPVAGGLLVLLLVVRWWRRR